MDNDLRNEALKLAPPAGDGSTTFNLPDLRGVFMRGWDDGRGYDSGRVFGSYQADDNKAHSHSGSCKIRGWELQAAVANATTETELEAIIW